MKLPNKPQGCKSSLEPVNQAIDQAVKLPMAQRGRRSRNSRRADFEQSLHLQQN